MALTRLYAATKLSYTSSFPQISPNDGSELLSLQRKYRIQRDRLVAWGLEWSDNTTTAAVPPKDSKRSTAPDYTPGLGFIFSGKASNITPDTKANIDDSLERAGLAEVVTSVLENIKGIITEVEQIRRKTLQPLSPSGFPLDKPGLRSNHAPNPWSASDRAHYDDLVKDLTSAVDLLCDLSHARRDASSIHPPSVTETAELGGTHAAFAPLSLHAIVPEQVTWHELDPSLTVPRLKPTCFRLIEEPPPLYNHFGVPCPVRVVGHIRRESLRRGSAMFKERLGSRDSVLIEYAPYDSIHRDTGLALPLSRLDVLFGLSSSAQAQAVKSIPKLIGYFEDPKMPQLGLVYELPMFLRKQLAAVSEEKKNSKVTTLVNLLQSGASRIHNNRQSSMTEVMYVPPLEERFVAAYKLVQAFSLLHDQGLCHRGVNSYNITFLSVPEPIGTSALSDSSFILREPIVTSFDLFSEYSLDTSPEYLHQNIYRHPDDPNVTAPDASKEYLPAFELYSLGLVLLEIGLWIPLSDMFKEKYSLKEFRTRIEKLYTKRLAGKCGTAYMRAVQDCLAGGNETGTSRGCLHAYYTRILQRLQKCTDLEEEELHSDGDVPDVLAEAVDDCVLEEPPPITESTANNCYLLSENPIRYRFWGVGVPEEISDAWMPQAQRIGKIVDKALRNSQETYSIGINMTGADRGTAKPTFVIGCTSVNIVEQWVAKFFEYDREVYDLVVYEDSIVRSKAIEVVSETSQRSNGGEEEQAKNPGHQERPLCGASVGAWREEVHLPPVSFGGVVLVDGEAYGMSVHHMMEDEDSTGLAQATRASLPPTQISDILTDPSDTDTDDDGDTAGILPPDDEEDEEDIENVRVTQPALDDVADGFFPDDENKDEDHLDSHLLGKIYASSGLRRSIVNGITYEIDWALIELEDHRLQPYNIVAGGRRYCRPRRRPSPPILREPVCRKPYKPHEDLFPWRVASMNEFKDFAVHVFGRTSGLVSGEMAKDRIFVKFPGRRSRTAVWEITGVLGPPGNSGAWVIENTEGRVCGYVLGRSKKRTGTAYMCAMELIFDDIKETLGARSITLPGQRSLAVPSASLQ